MAGDGIFVNESGMESAAAAFNGAAARMQEAHSVLMTSADALSAVWKGSGSESYETIKETSRAYCIKMSEMAATEAAKVQGASLRYTEADATAAASTAGLGS